MQPWPLTVRTTNPDRKLFKRSKSSHTTWIRPCCVSARCFVVPSWARVIYRISERLIAPWHHRLEPRVFWRKRLIVLRTASTRFPSRFSPGRGATGKNILCVLVISTYHRKRLRECANSLGLVSGRRKMQSAVKCHDIAKKILIAHFSEHEFGSGDPIVDCVRSCLHTMSTAKKNKTTAVSRKDVSNDVSVGRQLVAVYDKVERNVHL